MTASLSCGLLSTTWCGLVQLDTSQGYLIYGCEPGTRHALGVAPRYVAATASSPVKAYKRLVDLTGHAWCVAVREADLINLDGAYWTQMVRGVPKIKFISDQLWDWAEPIWEQARDDLPSSMERSRALWLNPRALNFHGTDWWAHEGTCDTPVNGRLVCGPESAGEAG